MSRPKSACAAWQMQRHRGRPGAGDYEMRRRRTFCGYRFAVAIRFAPAPSRHRQHAVGLAHSQHTQASKHSHVTHAHTRTQHKQHKLQTSTHACAHTCARTRRCHAHADAHACTHGGRCVHGRTHTPCVFACVLARSACLPACLPAVRVCVPPPPTPPPAPHRPPPLRPQPPTRHPPCQTLCGPYASPLIGPRRHRPCRCALHQPPSACAAQLSASCSWWQTGTPGYCNGSSRRTTRPAVGCMCGLPSAGPAPRSAGSTGAFMAAGL